MGDLLFRDDENKDILSILEKEEYTLKTKDQLLYHLHDIVIVGNGECYSEYLGGNEL